MSFKVFVKPVGERELVSNGLAFPTAESADAYGSDLLSRWMGAERYEVRSSDEPVHYYDRDGKLQEA